MIFNLSETNTGGGGTPVINPLSVAANGTYTAPSGVDGYSPVTVNVPQGLIIPSGFAYYNGILLPKIPEVEGYPYAWIRTNASAGVYNVIYGKSQWYSKSNATLDNFMLLYSTMSTDGAYQYKIADDGSETEWTFETISTATHYGLTTALGRKLIWTSHDIHINAGSNILYVTTPVISNP